MLKVNNSGKDWRNKEKDIRFIYSKNIKRASTGKCKKSILNLLGVKKTLVDIRVLTDSHHH